MARTRLGFILGIGLWLITQSGNAAITPPLPQPSWKQLSSEQQRVLAPLSGEWDQMEGFRRKKWLGIAQRFQSLSPDEQARMQRRMTSWAKLSPDERKRARDQYLSLQKASPEKKETVRMKWQEYKELPEEDKARLKAEAARRPTPRPAPSKPMSPTPAKAAGTTPANLAPPPPPTNSQSPTSGPAATR